MIKNDFYPDYSTLQDDLVLTNNVTSLNLTDSEVDPMAAYYMGEIGKSQNLLYRATFKYENGVYKLDRTANIKPKWGYAYSPGGVGNSPSHIAWNGSKWVQVGTAISFINAMKYYKATMTIGAYSLTCHLYDFSNEVILGTGEHIRTSTTDYTGSFNASTDGFYSVLYNNADWPVVINNQIYTLNLNNWNAAGCYFDVGDNKRVYITQIINASGNNYNCNYYNGHQFYLDLLYSIDTPDRLKSSRGCKIFRQFSHYYNGQISIDKDTNRAYSAGAQAYGGGADRVEVDEETVWAAKPFEVSYEVVNYCTTYSPTDHSNEFVINSNDDLVKNSGYSSVNVNSFLDVFSWIKYVLGIAPKWATNTKADGTTMTYNNNSPEYLPNTGVPIFNGKDSPDGRIVKTDTYRELEPELRPWQKYGYDITDDEYDPEGGGGGGSDDNWDPDTATGDDTNDYEEDPTTQLHEPFLGAIGQRWWAMENIEWSTIVRNVKKILTTWDEYVTFALPINLQNIEAEAHKNRYSSGFVANPVDCIAALVWYPFDITLVLDGEPADFVWGGTDQVIMTGVDSDGKPQTTTTEQTLITGYLNNAYWLDGGFTDYFKHYENFIDYHPYCTAELYVPYCGSVKIDPQQYVGHHISVRYLVDFPTGACLALIYRDNLVVDSIAGQIGVSIAMSMPDYLDYGGRHMQAATNVKASKLQTFGTIWNTMQKAFTGDLKGALANAPSIALGFESLKLAEYNLDNTLINQKTISTATPAISTGNEQTCRLVLYQPRWLDEYSKDDYGNYGHTTGFATIENKTLGSFEGLTIADSIDTSGINQATEKEKGMIQQAFKGGVYMQ